MRPCWCGNSELKPFSPDYGRCPICETLVYLKESPLEHHLVLDDERDYYGKKYWLEHQQEAFGYANIHTRCRSDLTERNLYWLKTLLKYRLPPAGILELGCAHGSFVALMSQTGYQVTGVEMSPWVVSFGRETFGVPISLGPIENLGIVPGTLDVLVLMDVLEHIPDPVSTMRCCLNLLNQKGFLVIQTPRFREEMKYEELVKLEGSFLKMLIPEEHLYLFSETSVKEFFKKLDAENIYFETPIFPQYDMFFIVSRFPLQPNTSDEIESSLLSTPSGRIALALLDLHERELTLIRQLSESEQDRSARFEQVITLTRQLSESKQDRSARLKQILSLTKKIKNKFRWW